MLDKLALTVLFSLKAHAQLMLELRISDGANFSISSGGRLNDNKCY